MCPTPTDPVAVRAEGNIFPREGVGSSSRHAVSERMECRDSMQSLRQLTSAARGALHPISDLERPHPRPLSRVYRQRPGPNWPPRRIPSLQARSTPTLCLRADVVTGFTCHRYAHRSSVRTTKSVAVDFSERIWSTNGLANTS